MTTKLVIDSCALNFIREFAERRKIQLWEYGEPTACGNIKLYQPISGRTGPTKEFVEHLAEIAQGEIKLLGLKNTVFVNTTSRSRLNQVFGSSHIDQAVYLLQVRSLTHLRI